MAKLPLSGQRWVWIIAGLLIIIMLGVLVSSVPSDYTEPVSGPKVADPVAAPIDRGDGGPYHPGVAPAKQPED